MATTHLSGFQLISTCLLFLLSPLIDPGHRSPGKKCLQRVRVQTGLATGHFCIGLPTKGLEDPRGPDTNAGAPPTPPWHPAAAPIRWGTIPADDLAAAPPSTPPAPSPMAILHSAAGAIFPPYRRRRRPPH